jgi:hypothetical protein
LVGTMGALAQRAIEGSFDKTLNVSGPIDIDLSTGSGRIEVEPGPTGQVRVQAEVRVGQWNRSRQEAERILERLVNNPPIEQSGTAIKIGSTDDPDLRRDVGISYHITAPKETRLHSRTGSGNQDIVGITGPITARTGSGDIVAENAGGSFEGHTGSGSVRFIQSAPGDVIISTGSGNVDAALVKGALNVRTGSGSVRAAGEPTGSWDLQTGSGSVKLGLPQVGFNLDAHTGSGGITVTHPLTVRGSIRKNELIGTVRGGGIPVQIRTGSGSIQVE